jgi:Heat induced stress protein YflT domain
MGKKAKKRAGQDLGRPRRGGDVLAGTVPVATFAALGEVQDALARLADGGFPIDRATVVGTDLRLVERVAGRMTSPRAAGYGTVAGTWLGALIAAFAAIFTGTSFGAVLSMLFGGIMFGALFGAVFGLVAYRFAGPRDGITTNLSLVASCYELRADASSVDRLRALLATAGAAPATADDLLTRP